jgi:hypothetical protein
MSLNAAIIASSALAVALLFMACWFALRYTSAFYGPRPAPKSWLLIMVSLLALAIAEAGELFVFIEVAILRTLPGIPVGVLELGAHTVAGIALLLGAYWLYKEVP